MQHQQKFFVCFFFFKERMFSMIIQKKGQKKIAGPNTEQYKVNRHARFAEEVNLRVTR